MSNYENALWPRSLEQQSDTIVNLLGAESLRGTSCIVNK